MGSWFRNFSVLISQVDVWTYLFVAKGKAFLTTEKYDQMIGGIKGQMTMLCMSQ